MKICMPRTNTPDGCSALGPGTYAARVTSGETLRGEHQASRRASICPWTRSINLTHVRPDNFVILDRNGSTLVEMTPGLVDANRRPTGERGALL